MKVWQFILLLVFALITGFFLAVVFSPAKLSGEPEPSEPELTQVMYPLDIPTGEALEPFYPLTDSEYNFVAGIIMAEAGNQGLHGQKLVAQCLLQACLDTDLRPTEAAEVYKYGKPHDNPSNEVYEALTVIFTVGEMASDEPVKYFYNPALCESAWHESQDFVIEHKEHRFFKEVER